MAYFGDCLWCVHDWREHPPVVDEVACSECRYEMEHEEPAAPLELCKATAPLLGPSAPDG